MRKTKLGANRPGVSEPPPPALSPHGDNSGAGSEPDNNTSPGEDYFRTDNGEGGTQVSALFGIDKQTEKIVMQVDKTPVKPVKWDVINRDSHHLSGNLVFPEKDSSGNPLIKADSKVRLIIRDLRNVNERVLTWENPPVRPEG
ncbi:MAG: hypothetical protein CVU89_06885 [Firmicutes bacterium HGW-Firmicutes-14]|nr:MAG: hypothetical protein CVU89_06885 [Firmicutes bacterium HGW-Firmicutes-14]